MLTINYDRQDVGLVEIIEVESFRYVEQPKPPAGEDFLPSTGAVFLVNRQNEVEPLKTFEDGIITVQNAAGAVIATFDLGGQLTPAAYARRSMQRAA